MATSDVITQVNSNEAAIADFQSTALAALETMTADAALPFLSWFDFASIIPPALSTPGKVTLKDIPAFQAVSMTSAPTFDYTPALFDALEAQVMNIVNSGGADIAPAIQDAVFNQGQERLLQTTKDALDLTGARTGAKGCRYANSMTKALQAEIALNFTWQKSDLSRQITQTMGELVQRNLQMAINAGISIQQVQADIAIKVYTVLLEGQRLIVEKYKIATDAAAVVFEANLKGALAQLEADMDNSKLSIEEQQQVVELFRQTSQNIIETGRSEIVQAQEANRLKVELIKAVASGYSSLAQSLSNQTVSILKG